MSLWMNGEKGVDCRVSNRPFQSAISLITTGSTVTCLLLCLLLLPGVPATLAQSSAPQQNPQPSQGILQVETLIQQGHLNEAKTAVQSEIQRNPGSVQAYNLLGIIDSNQQNYSDAVAAFGRALQLAPNSAKTHNNLGNAYVAQKKVDLAEKEFRTVLRLDSTDPEGNYNLGVLLMAKGLPTQAIAQLERVHPPNLPTKVKLVQANFQAKHPAEALHLASELSAQNPNDIQLHFSLGILLAAEKQYKPARLELEKADALRPGTFEIPFSLGQVFLRSADYPKAELVLDRALTVKPDSADTLFLLAQVYHDEGRPLDALNLLVRAHKIAPDNIDISYLMAQVSISQNYFEDAIPLLESALVIAPQRPDLLAALGESYFMSGKVDKAIDVFNKLIEVDRSARSYAYLGLSYRHLGRFEEATQYFDKGLKLDPHNSSCLFNLGLIAERPRFSSSKSSRPIPATLTHSWNWPI
jgi:protein O-GlcNAc transferase